MSSDNSRFTFDPWKDYSGVVQQQGRVQTDADSNEGLAQSHRRLQAETLDLIGHAGYPATTPFAFEIAANSSGGNNSLRIGLGRMYVDGLLVENHGKVSSAVWDSALAELSNTPQPPPTVLGPLDATNSIDFSEQPNPPMYGLPAGSGSYLVYLDLWQRPVTSVIDPNLIDKAIGIDTAGRLQTAWQVNLMPATGDTITGAVTSGSFVQGEVVAQTTSGATGTVIGPVPGAGPLTVDGIGGSPDAKDTWVGKTSGAVFTPTAAPVPAAWNCSTPDSEIPWPVSAGTLTVTPVQSGPNGPCCLSAGTGYTGVDNQLYRLEIHYPGGSGGANATFKWSRENASVQTRVTQIQTGQNTLGQPASVLTVDSLGKDQVLGFNPGNWIEITDAEADNNCLQGEMYKIDSVDVPTSTITLTTLLSATFTPATLAANAYTRIVRWDQAGKVYRSDKTLYTDLDAIGSGTTPNGFFGVPVPTDGSILVLENGIAVNLTLSPANGSFQPLNYWTFAARTADGSIETLTDAPPRGIHHHYTKLSVVTFGSSVSAPDCRTPIPTGDGGECGCCCTVTVGDGVNSFGKFSSIQKALDSLPHSGGEICILPGHYYENVLIYRRRNIVIHGCRWRSFIMSKSLQPGAPSTGAPVTAASLSGQAAVFTVAGSSEIRFETLMVEADDGEVGILLDGYVQKAGTTTGTNASPIGVSNYDVAIHALSLASSTRPAIAAIAVQELHVEDCEIEGEEVANLYPSVYLSGEQVFFERNLLRIRGKRGANVGSFTEAGNLAPAEMAAAYTKSSVVAIGGIQVGGPSDGVVITDNRLEGGSRNGITLGNLVHLDTDGGLTHEFVGVLVAPENECAPKPSALIPGTPGSRSSGGGYVTGGRIVDLRIERNQIQNFGMAGIGPVGFFDLKTVFEVVSLRDLHIIENTITQTLLRSVEPASQDVTPFGYGAITLPEVSELHVRDNMISEFGSSPADDVCGIYIQQGAGVEITRNEITNDAYRIAKITAGSSQNPIRAGIYIHSVTGSETSFFNATSVLLAGALDHVGKTSEAQALHRGAEYLTRMGSMPAPIALRIQQNEVRVPYGLALFARGSGVFSILDNHFSTQGELPNQLSAAANFASGKVAGTAASSSAGYPTLASATGIYSEGNQVRTVEIMNMGEAIETAAGVSRFASDNQVFTFGRSPGTVYRGAGTPEGSVIFANNIVRLITSLRARTGFCSVSILTLDHLTFQSNLLMVEGVEETVDVNAMLKGATTIVTSNRFQESTNYAARYSAYTLGEMNMTTQNIATHCIVAKGGKVHDTPNMILDPQLCKEYARAGQLSGMNTGSAAPAGASEPTGAEG